MFEESTLGVLDIGFLVVSLAITVLIGLYFANKNKTFADYARGGGNQNLWAVSASMAAGYCSALTLIGNPSELYMHGTSFTVKMATTILAWPVSSFVFLPVFKRLDGISIFQYIENRFSPWLRRFVSLLFVFQMTFYSAVSLYLPSLPLFTTLKIPQVFSVGLIGLVCIVYSSFGGLKAVTWTNLYHTILLLTTMITIIVVGTIQSGGLVHVLKESHEAGRLSLGQDYFRLDLTSRHTIFNTILGYTLVRLFLHGTSQMQVQSALSLSTMRKSQASQLISAVFYFIIQIVASAIGLVLLVNYKNCDPYLNGEIGRQDELLMHYLHKSLNSVPILQGMFIAAIFGSTLTTMSSYLSSTSAMLVEDFVGPIHAKLTGNKTKLSESRSAQIGKLGAVFLGLLCILLTLEMGKISGLQQATTTIYGVIGIPILSAFVLGTMTKFITTPGMFAGMIASIAFGVYVFIGHLVDKPQLEPSLPISTMGCARRLTQADSFNMPANVTSTTLSDLFTVDDDETVAVITNVTTDELLATAATTTTTLKLIKQVDVQSLEDFKLAHMSYLWLPLFTMTISVVVASLVSLLTGGLKQTVDERFLAPKLTKVLTGKTKQTLKQLNVCGASSYDSIEIKLKQQDCCEQTVASSMTFVDLVDGNCCKDVECCASGLKQRQDQNESKPPV